MGTKHIYEISLIGALKRLFALCKVKRVKSQKRPVIHYTH